MRILLIFIMLFCNVSFAQEIGCDSYLKTNNNIIFNVGIVTGKNPDSLYAQELSADREIKKNGYLLQYFYLTKYRQQPLYLSCVYTDGNIVKPIPQNIKTCVRKYTLRKDSKELPSISCS